MKAFEPELRRDVCPDPAPVMPPITPDGQVAIERLLGECATALKSTGYEFFLVAAGSSLADGSAIGHFRASMSTRGWSFLAGRVLVEFMQSTAARGLQPHEVAHAAMELVSAAGKTAMGSAGYLQAVFVDLLRGGIWGHSSPPPEQPKNPA